jgi:hypothetical protein
MLLQDALKLLDNNGRQQQPCERSQPCTVRVASRGGQAANPHSTARGARHRGGDMHSAGRVRLPREGSHSPTQNATSQPVRLRAMSSMPSRLQDMSAHVTLRGSR